MVYLVVGYYVTRECASCGGFFDVAAYSVHATDQSQRSGRASCCRGYATLQHLKLYNIEHQKNENTCSMLFDMRIFGVL